MESIRARHPGVCDVMALADGDREDLLPPPILVKQRARVRATTRGYSRVSVPLYALYDIAEQGI